MDTVTSKLIVSGILFLLTVSSGITLGLIGRPLNSAIFGIHKIVAVGMAVLVVLVVRQLHSQGINLGTLDVGILALTGFLEVKCATFTTVPARASHLEADSRLVARRVRECLEIHEIYRQDFF